MPDRPPSKVLITGGREVGGLQTFASGLAEGFQELDIPAEVIPPGEVFKRAGQLRDSGILKILSTGAVFAAPIARRAICVAHGIPRADAQGWPKVAAIIASYKVTNRSSGARLVAVSGYSAVHLRGLFKVKVDAVIGNPLQSVYFEPFEEGERRYVTFIGRLVEAKNVHRLLPAMCEVRKEIPALRVCVIGDGPLRESLQASYPDVEFTGNLTSLDVRRYLRKTEVFVSGTETEGFGIAYLEALSQGCAVAMPACGGGLEIALDQIGKRIHLLPLSWDQCEVAGILRRAICSGVPRLDLSQFRSDAVADLYLDLDRKLGKLE